MHARVIDRTTPRHLMASDLGVWVDKVVALVLSHISWLLSASCAVLLKHLL
jgi:hypothetical protein